jgi:hypothetical protein
MELIIELKIHVYEKVKDVIGFITRNDDIDIMFF